MPTLNLNPKPETANHHDDPLTPHIFKRWQDYTVLQYSNYLFHWSSSCFCCGQDTGSGSARPKHRSVGAVGHPRKTKEAPTTITWDAGPASGT